MTSPFVKTVISDDDRSITFYPKKDATWPQMTSWLEDNYSDPAYTWRGFGNLHAGDFCIVLVRRWDDEDYEENEEDEDESESESEEESEEESVEEEQETDEEAEAEKKVNLTQGA